MNSLSDLSTSIVVRKRVWDVWSRFRPPCSRSLVDFTAEGRGITRALTIIILRAQIPGCLYSSVRLKSTREQLMVKFPMSGCNFVSSYCVLWYDAMRGFCFSEVKRVGFSLPGLLNYNVYRYITLKQCVFCSPSQMVRGRGNFLRIRYFSTGPSGRPRSLSASL